MAARCGCASTSATATATTRKVNTGGKEAKFGLSAQRVDEFVEAARALDVRVTGVRAHLGSGVENSSHWQQMVDELAGFARRIGSVEILDIGGGLPIPYSDDDEPFDLEAWAAGLAAIKAVRPAFQLAVNRVASSLPKPACCWPMPRRWWKKTACAASVWMRA